MNTHKIASTLKDALIVLIAAAFSFSNLLLLTSCGKKNESTKAQLEALEKIRDQEVQQANNRLELSKAQIKYGETAAKVATPSATTTTTATTTVKTEKAAVTPPAPTVISAPAPAPAPVTPIPVTIVPPPAPTPTPPVPVATAPTLLSPASPPLTGITDTLQQGGRDK